MLINGIDISSLGVKLYDRVLNSNSINTVDDWLDGDIQPTYIRQQDKFKYIKLSFLVLGNNEDDAFHRISRLTQELRKATIIFDDIDLSFDVAVYGSADTQRLKNGNFIVSYKLRSDYAKGEREIYTTNANLTNAFKLTVLYYQNSTQLLATDSVTIRASSFTSENVGLNDIGIDVDKYIPDYYNHGVATNLNGLEITYANLQYLNTLIINYTSIAYNLTLEYMLGDNDNYFNEFLTETITFTYPQLQSIQTIGQLINPQKYKPEGYKANITFQGELTVENILAQSPMSVLYERIQNARSKNILVNYYSEGDNEVWVPITTAIVNVTETQFYDGYTLGDLLNISAERPNQIHYNEGYVIDHNLTELIEYETIEASYTIRYPRSTNILFVEYYVGTYPNWYRLTTSTISTKYQDSYENDFTLSMLDLDIDKYHTSEYESGRVYNSGALDTYDNVVNVGVIQVYYVPIDYTITVRFQADDDTPTTETFTINALDFLNDPVLTDLIPINDYKPANYQLDLEGSYSGPITLAGLTQASPILIHFEEIHADRTKNILIHYKQELATIFSTINTSLITISESDCVGGVRLKDLINLNLYKPEYYENGLLDGYSHTALLGYDDLQSEYNVLYSASVYSTPVKYYIDSIDDQHWISSSSIDYRIIDFETTTTLYDLGLSLNAHKPSYCDDGVLQYNGAVNFGALREVESIIIIYPTREEPVIDDGIDYPHRFLFLQHNDLGDWEGLHPEWTLNHAYINTGITAQDMSKLTVVMECKRVDDNVPLHDVNGAYGYLFGSSSSQGQFYMRFNNQTQYHAGELTGINTYEARAGLYTNQLTVTEENAIGFSENAGIYASARDGYSNVCFTYTYPLQTEHTRMSYPLYLFANNNAGMYEHGLAGIGIFGCRIYYDNVLVRDMIPVQYYDKIGDLVAPSNCLYDKITQTFFEDATGMNSFNIIDDDRYEDTNPEHMIGFCYVNYYQGDARFKTVKYSFRASDFIDQVYDPYTAWRVDANQPSFYKPGVIQNYVSIDRSFNGLNTRTFDVVYEEDENFIIVNYYKDNTLDAPELLATDVISLSQQDFYQVPTFGDIVRLNKYKPEGYKTDYEFPEPKVSLTRVLSHSPYTITYTPERDTLADYTTTIRYIKKIYGIRAYETIDEITLHFDQTDFRDGEYIDFYIDKNARKPANYYLDGENYQWYDMDERLTTPEDLKPLYIIKYDCETQYISVNYYTDDWDEANLIASTTWSFKLDDFDPSYPFYIVDQLPNTYINKYRPANCDGGVLQDSNITHTFYTLAELDEIAIVYDSLVEPHDPTEAYYESKALVWGNICNNLHPSIKEITQTALNLGFVIAPWRIPYIDLGYRPKEIGRLRVEYTGSAIPVGVQTPRSGYSYFSNAFTTIFGYWGAPEFVSYDQTNYSQVMAVPGLTANEFITADASYSGASKGCFAIQTRLPSTEGASWVYSYNGPSSIDGQAYTNNVLAQRNTVNNVAWNKPGIIAHFRRGFNHDVDDNYEIIDVFNDYRFTKSFIGSEIPDKETDGYMQVNSDRLMAKGLYSYDDEERVAGGNQPGTWVGNYALANPFTVVLDAYNDYCSIWNYHDSNYPFVWQINNTDNPIWEDIERPRGSLSLFTATNPTTGKPNILDDIYWSYPSLSGITGSYALQFAASAIGVNPYTASEEDHYGSIVYEVETAVPGQVDGNGQPVVQISTQTRNALFADWMTPTFPWVNGSVLWSLKIYDQGRLVRDLVPVDAGDVIYDYTMPDVGLFDLVTEIFFGDSNPGHITQHGGDTITYTPTRMYAVPDILSYGKITTNYYDYDNTFIDNKWVDVPTWFCGSNTTIEDILEWNDFKPDDYHLDGWIDVDQDWSWQGNRMNLAQIYEMGTVNIYYRLRTFTKTVVYYKGDVRVGSRDLMYSLDDIRQANSLADLGIDLDLYYDNQFQHGKVIFNSSVIANDDIETFINAPSPVVVYEPLSQQQAPNLLYIQYYRGGAYDNNLTLDVRDNNYLVTTGTPIEARVLNPYGAIMYYDHYHQALYEDEDFGEFIPYQVRILNKYTGLHYGPGRRYKTLAMVIEPDIYTIIQERNGWGRLREYPNAWILLNATEAVTGPGQNPAYDVADSTVQTVPYGEYIYITRMTIDKLWCYCASLGSWIKTEDISLSQRGKQFEGLKIEVIDLNSKTFTNATSLADIGIDIQKWRLYFHEAGQVYGGTPEISYWDLSNRHILEVIYPETIYTYSCIYYDTKVAPEHIQGTAGFSCSLSDWNPDWDTFIGTSWQRTELEGTAKVVIQNGSGSVTVRSEPDVSSASVTGIPEGTTINLLSTVFTQGTYDWYKIRYNDYVGYMIADFVSVQENYGGMIDIMPTLYRDTTLTLTWDYFGFDRDKYRGGGQGHGIYLWNPRTWDNDNIKFSFQELVSCGTQKVLYPSFDPTVYKLLIEHNYLNESYSSNGTTTYLMSPGVQIDLSDPNYESRYYLESSQHYDVYINAEWRNDLGVQGAGGQPGHAYQTSNYTNPRYNITVGESYTKSWGSVSSSTTTNYGRTFSGVIMPYGVSMMVYAGYDETPTALMNIENGDRLIFNWSNYRYSPTAIIGTGSYIRNKPAEYYIIGHHTEPISDSLNLSGYNLTHGQLLGSSWSGTSQNQTKARKRLEHTWCLGTIYEILAYSDYNLIHYYAPIPQGMMYRYGNDYATAECNGLLDLITGQFYRGFRAGDWQTHNAVHFTEYFGYPQPNLNLWTGTHGDGKELIFLRNQSDLGERYAFYYFDNWNPTVTRVNPPLFKQVTGDVIVYTKPTTYAQRIRTLTTDLIIPIYNKSTQDSTTWWKVADGWISGLSQNLNTVTASGNGSSYNTWISAYDTTVCLISPTGTVYGYQDPLAVFDVDTRSNYAYSAPAFIKIYAKCQTSVGNMLFDGAHWLPEVYTSNNKTEVNRNYAITRTTHYYSCPIADNTYRLGNYSYGQRVLVTNILVQDSNWGQTSDGWIELLGNTSEVV